MTSGGFHGAHRYYSALAAIDRACQRRLLTISVEHSRDERPEPILIEGTRPPGRLRGETRWALKREGDPSGAQELARSRDDIVVKAVMVQGGEADIGGEKTAFARIVMSGVGVQQVKVDDHAPRRQEVAVLKLDDAAVFADGLHEVVDRIVRSTPTPAVPAMGNWSWTSTPPLDEDLLVAQASADGAAVPAVTGMTSTVRVDFTGTLVQGLTVANPAVHVQGAIFSGPRQAQALVSSLRKVVRSALAQGRAENYVSRPFRI